MHDHLIKYLGYIKNTGAPIMRTEFFDEDWAPVGTAVRAQLEEAGLVDQEPGAIALSIKGEDLLSSKVPPVDTDRQPANLRGNMEL